MKKGFVLLLRRWMVERSFAWAARFHRLARNYERLPEILAFAIPILRLVFETMLIGYSSYHPLGSGDR